MTKIKRLLLYVILSLPICLSAQDNPLLRQFADYRKKAFTEKVYIHTDKNNYLAGQILWWKLYYVDGYLHKPTDLSKVVYVEVLDNNNRPILQAKAALTKDGSNGSFYVPLSAGTGNYTIRAYTNWMKNFGADYFFSKPISIINSLKGGAAQKAASTKLYDAGFFPEGGNLVKNIESRLAYRVTDQYGKGQAFTGVLIDENKDSILTFSPMKNGIGSFVFTPAGSHHYQAILKFADGQTITKELPQIFENGYVMQVSGGETGPIKVTVTTNLTSARKAFLFIHTRQVVKINTFENFENGRVTFSIDRKSLGEGISHFTVFDDRQYPVCERLYFTYPQKKLTIESAADNAVYNERKKVNLQVQTKINTAAAAGSLSLSVYRMDSLQQDQGENIQSYLWLSSDLKGTVESPASYFDEKANGIKLAMDNLMLTHGWRRFSWDSLTTDKTRFAYQPEFDGHIVSGTLKNARGVPAPDVNVFLSIPGNLVQFYAVKSDAEGRVHFDVRDYYGPGQIILQADSTIATDFQIAVENPFSSKYDDGTILPAFAISPANSGSLAKASFGMQVQNIYVIDSINKYYLPQMDTIPFYGKHGGFYRLDDYVRFTTMEEVLREYVHEVGVRLRNGEPHVMVLDVVNKGFLSQEPIILLDGVPVSHSSILAFDPLKVSTLQVIAARYLIGDFVYDGVVSFSTYHRSVEDLPISRRATTLDYEGFQLKREFFSPVYETESEVANRLPDYRDLLYWTPDLKTDSSGAAKVDFYTSDIPGKYVVVIEGMDDAGNAGSTNFTFEVKP